MPTVLYDHQIFSHQDFGGVSRYFCELAGRVPEQSAWRARILAPLHYNRYLAQTRVPTVGVYLPLRSQRLGRICAKVNDLVAPTFARFVDCDLIHQTYYGRRSGNPRVPFVITVFDMIHELFPEYFSPSDPVLRLKRQLVDAADHVICISQRTASDLVRILGVPPEKVSTTYLSHSSVFAAEQSVPVTPSASRERPYLLYVGKRGGYKNFARVLEAYGSSAPLRERCDLVAFGGGPFTAEELAKFAALNLGSGSIRQASGDDVALAGCYRGARAFVYPSEYEGFGIPPLEAMGCGCVVVCSNSSSIPEVVGDAGEYFEPRDVDSIRTSLETVVLDDERHAVLRLAGSRQCGLFSWDRCARETLAVYEKVIRTNRSMAE